MVRGVGCVGGVPAGGHNSKAGEGADVVAATAPVVEEAGVSIEQSVGMRLLQWPRQKSSCHGGAVAGDSGGHTSILVACRLRRTDLVARGSRSVSVPLWDSEGCREG